MNDKDARDMADLAFGGSSAVSGDASELGPFASKFDQWAAWQMMGENLTSGQINLMRRAWNAAIASQASLAKRGTEPSLLARINEAASLHASRTEFGEVIFPADRWDAFVLALAESAPSETPGAEAIRGEHFVRAWLNLDKLPGGMMIGPEGKFGPVPASTSCWVTTSQRERDRFVASGKPMLEMWLASHAETVPHVPAGKTLTDEQCNEFRRMPLSFNDMVRAIYEAGLASMQAEAPAGQGEQS